MTFLDIVQLIFISIVVIIGLGGIIYVLKNEDRVKD
ncbi:cellulose biosynthesis protein BcsF [Campylobacter lari]|nr:cellulose biosynthesis protein BcsF [Campylobacter lari]EAL0271731.1 cellulose biosynthesis protein BcsF [Campylobacter lari]MCR6537224.1 cellulose biosynthesis protein BcsF [Campylobacter lari]